MSWNYRVVKRVVKRPNGEIVKSFALYEVYYYDHGHPRAVTVDPVPLRGESAAEVARAYDLACRALREPVLEYEKIGRCRCRACAAERRLAQQERRAARRPGRACTRPRSDRHRGAAPPL